LDHLVCRGERHKESWHWYRNRCLAHGNASFGGEEQEGAEATVAAASAGF
jgi:hypothetical protein